MSESVKYSRTAHGTFTKEDQDRLNQMGVAVAPPRLTPGTGFCPGWNWPASAFVQDGDEMSEQTTPPGFARQAFALAMAVGLGHIALPMLFGPWLAITYLARTHRPSGLSDLQIIAVGIVAVPIGAVLLAAVYRLGRWGGVWR